MIDIEKIRLQLKANAAGLSPDQYLVRQQLDAWMKELDLASPDTDPFYFLLTKLAELSVAINKAAKR